MKRAFKYLILTSLSGLMCLFLVIPANAQRGGHGGGGGHSGGGGGGHFSGGGHVSAGGGGHFSGGGRSVSAAPSRSFAARPGGGFRGATGHAAVANGFHGAVGVRGGFHGGVVAHGGYVGHYGAVGRGGYGRGYYGRGGYYGHGFYGPHYWGARGWWGGRGGFYWGGGFYASLYWPRLGFSVGFLPYGYYPFYWGDAQYYYSNGFYYQYNNSQYTVVEPPLGAEITTLPANAQPITIDGQQYYELNGVYYQPVTKDDGSTTYVIAGKDGRLDTGNGANAQPNGNNVSAAPQQAPQIGDMYNELPQDSRKIKINGETFYVSPDDYYYQITTDNSGNKVYKIVGTPSDEPGN
jgi:hypothetical protein